MLGDIRIRIVGDVSVSEPYKGCDDDEDQEFFHGCLWCSDKAIWISAASSLPNLGTRTWRRNEVHMGGIFSIVC